MFAHLIVSHEDIPVVSESWTSTPVRASQRYEFLDEQKYTFSYGEELVKHLRSYGYKPAVGYTLADTDAETDLAVLLANLAQVLSRISHFEIEKLLDLDYEYSRSRSIRKCIYKKTAAIFSPKF